MSPADATELMFRHGQDVDAYVRGTNDLAVVAQRDREQKSSSVLAHLNQVAASREKERKQLEATRQKEEMCDKMAASRITGL